MTRALAAFALLAGMTPALGQGLITQHRLSHALAGEAAMVAVEHCRKMTYAVTVAVVDIDGVRQAVLRGDGAAPQSLDTAYAKAMTALYYRADTIEIVPRMQNVGPASIQAKIPYIVISQGGVVIKLDDEVIGAIGISGAPGQDFDTQCARAGIAAIRDRMK